MANHLRLRNLTSVAWILILLAILIQPIHSFQPIGCTPPAFCANFTVTGITPQTTNFIATPTGGTPPFSFSWNFGDGSNDTGESVTHSFPSPNTYLVTLVASDSSGQSFTISHDITEVQSLPSSPFALGAMPSWNTHVTCLASPTTISGIVGTTSNSYGGADLSGAKTTSLILKHTLDYPCENFGFSIFVEIHNLTVSYGPFTTTDCSTISGADSCDVVGNIANLGQPCDACLPGTVYMNEMRWEVERQWSASGNDAASLAAYGWPQQGQQLDVQGFVYWSFSAPADATHDYSGWYLELTAWKPAQPGISKCTLSDFNRDGKVNIFDLSLLGYHYDTSQGVPLYASSFDLNNDGRINILDLSIFALSYGKTC